MLGPGLTDGDLRRMLYGITALAQRIETIRSQFADRLGITTPQYNILLYIAEHQGETGITVTDVAQALSVSGPHVTAESRSLMTAGLLEKTPNPRDGRSVLLRLSPLAEDQVGRLALVLRRVNDRLFKSLTREEFTAARDFYTLMLDDAQRTVAELPYLLGEGDP